jgi:hypothetical protein
MPAATIVESHVLRAHARGCSRLPNSAQQEEKMCSLYMRMDVEHSVPDIRDLVISVSEPGSGLPEESIWP